MALERTFVICKPDAVTRGLVGEVISRLEKKGLKLVACKFMALSTELLSKHYAHIADKPFFPGVVESMQLTPCVCMAWEGVDAVAVVRALMGPTNARTAPAGTIRGDLSMSIQMNIVHGSDSVETAKKEIALYFKPAELYSYGKLTDAVVNSRDERK